MKQIQKIKEEFYREFVKDNGSQVNPSFRDPNGDVYLVWKFFESKLAQLQKETLEEVYSELHGEISSVQSPKLSKGWVIEQINKVFLEFRERQGI